MSVVALQTPPGALHADNIESSKNAAFSALVRKHSDDLFRFAYWLSGDRDIAQDLVQETCLRAWRAIDQLQDPEKAKPWLLTTVRRENARRFQRYQPTLSEVPLDTLASDAAPVEQSAEINTVRRALKRLPVKYREPLVLQVLFGYTLKEIGVLLDLPENTAAVRVFRAKKLLREKLAGHGE